MEIGLMGKENMKHSDIQVSLCAHESLMRIFMRRALYRPAEMIRLWNGFHEKLGNEAQTISDGSSTLVEAPSRVEVHDRLITGTPRPQTLFVHDFRLLEAACSTYVLLRQSNAMLIPKVTSSSIGLVFTV
jgi:hypothetical protein